MLGYSIFSIKFPYIFLQYVSFWTPKSFIVHLGIQNLTLNKIFLLAVEKTVDTCLENRHIVFILILLYILIKWAKQLYVSYKG